ncbi:type III-A CRISPR-associated protein Csm2 [Desulfotruncus alcoholivorax]|uniref:type III-A CRISPR-associated protein Csm2 n=1 Tax=Desulfotruncus alcoholivorax TaxID=265477 RepID=UPI00041AE286|nr:type III-A CRISPR-associated protein Csm2 [Desulfotruncus alcoholivorax]
MNKEYVDKAKKVVESLKNDQGKISLTTSQIRKFLAGVNAVKNKLQIYESQGLIREDRLHEDILRDIQALKVKLIYQCGREPKIVKPFAEKAELIKEIDAIKTSVSKFRNFAAYIEAIVAYHKFEGGRD